MLAKMKPVGSTLVGSTSMTVAEVENVIRIPGRHWV